MDLRQHLGVIRRWIPLAVVGAILAGVVAYAIVSTQPRVYETSATLKLGQPLSGAPILLTPVSDRLLTEYAYRGTSLRTLEAVAEGSELEATATDLRSRVSTEVQPSSALLTITARGNSPEDAAALANGVGEALIASSEVSQDESIVQQALIEDLESLRAEISAVQARIADLRSRADLPLAQQNELADREDELVVRIAAYGDAVDRLVSSGAHSLQFVTPAPLPVDPVEPRPLLYTALAVLTGLLLAATIAAVLQYFDDSVRTPADLEATTDAPTLGSVAERTGDARAGGVKRLVTISSPRSASAEEYRRLRANVEIAAGGEGPRTLLVTGTQPATGIPVVAANLAVAFAEGGVRVLLIDAAFRAPRVHELFGLPNERGLATLLQVGNLAPEAVMVRTKVPNVQLIGTGTGATNPAGVMSQAWLRAVMTRLKPLADVVIVAGPPLPAASDAAVLSAELGQVLLVVMRGKTRRRAVRAALDALTVAKARVVGTALFGQQRGQTRVEPVPVSGSSVEKPDSSRAAERA